jgi:hypothetical protein
MHKVRFMISVGLLVFLLGAVSPPAKAQEGSASQAWATVQEEVKAMDQAVQSKNLHAIHEPSMKIRSAIKTLKGHSQMLNESKSQKMAAALKELDTAVTDVHSASDNGNQGEAEKAAKELDKALAQLQALNADAAFKNM